MKIWNAQSLSQALVNALAVSAKFVHDDIVNPPQGISNISEWCKREACWSRLLSGIEKLEIILPDAFWHELISFEEMDSETKAAKKTQKIDNGIDAQKKVFSIPPDQWLKINEELSKKQILSPKEVGILQVACQMPNRIPSEKQSIILLDIYEKAKSEGLFA